MKVKEHHFWFLTVIIVFSSFSIVSKKLAVHSSQRNLRETIVKENCVKCALFPSKNNITQIIVDLIKQEQKSIKIAMYLLTDKSIAEALVQAKQMQNIEIELITCGTTLSSTSNKALFLQNNDINVYIFHPCKNKKYCEPRMHDKFFIFEKNIDDKSILCTGSFNCTKNAQENNKENVIILEDKYFIELFKQEFEDIKQETKILKNYKPKNTKTYNA